MNKETIDKAAWDYAEENAWYPGETSYECDIREMEKSFADAYIAGARWRINAAWHDAREESPSGFKLMLLQDENGEIDLGYMLPPNITRWAYVADLIPDDGKEGGQ